MLPPGSNEERDGVFPKDHGAKLEPLERDCK